MPEVPILDEKLFFRRQLQRSDMTLEALFRGIVKAVDVTGDPLVTAFHSFRVGLQLGRDFPPEADRLLREFYRRAERELRERGAKEAARAAVVEELSRFPRGGQG